MSTKKNEHQGKWVFASNEHFGPNRHFGNDEHWGRWALSTRANRQLRQMGILGPIDIGANAHWGKMDTGKNEHQSKWAFAIGQLGQMSALGKWVFGSNGDLFGTNGTESM